MKPNKMPRNIPDIADTCKKGRTKMTRTRERGQRTYNISKCKLSKIKKEKSEKKNCSLKLGIYNTYGGGFSFRNKRS